MSALFFSVVLSPFVTLSAQTPFSVVVFVFEHECTISRCVRVCSWWDSCQITWKHFQCFIRTSQNLPLTQRCKTDKDNQMTNVQFSQSAIFFTFFPPKSNSSNIYLLFWTPTFVAFSICFRFVDSRYTCTCFSFYFHQIQMPRTLVHIRPS